MIVIQTDRFETQSLLSEVSRDWIFCMLPTEALSEGLEATLLEWKLATPVETAFDTSILEEGQHRQETRLVLRAHKAWDGWKPLRESRAILLDGHLLRMTLP